MRYPLYPYYPLSAIRYPPPQGIDFDNLSAAHGYEPFAAYGQSKLANALFARELARRLRDGPVTANAVHPGIVDTGLARHVPPERRWAYDRTIAQGAATISHVAVSPLLAGVSGGYFADCNPAAPPPRMLDERLARRLWLASEALARPWLA